VSNKNALGFNGDMDELRISNIQRTFAPGPVVELISAVKPSFASLSVGTHYQLQVSGDMTNWTNEGQPFSATSTRMIYQQYWDVENWGQLFFRLMISP